MSQRDMMRLAMARSAAEDDDDDDEEDAAPEEAAEVATAPSPTETSSVATSAAESLPAESAQAESAQAESGPAESLPATDSATTIASTSTADGQEASTPIRLGDRNRPADGDDEGDEAKLDTSLAADARTLKSIVHRKPDAPLSQGERRTRSAENMERISSALTAWTRASYKVPKIVLNDTRGRPGLSWRVAILPQLGYEELYKKFDLTQPWDGPTNKPLLELIPDEFASPERFDVHTNYQLFVNGPALYSETEEKDKSDISDAPDIVLLAEVDDDLAVPWTAPFDYDITKNNLGAGLGSLRSDGLFVTWYNGSVSVWPKPIKPGVLLKAITFEAGDGIPFARYMKFPSPVPGQDMRPSLGGTAANTLVRDKSTGPVNAGISTHTRPVMPGSDDGEIYNSPYVREKVPSQELILAAETKVRDTYDGYFKAARTTVEFGKLAETMASHMNQNELSLPERYVMLRTTINVAIRGEDAPLALRLLQEMDERFFVNRTQLEVSLLNGFLGKKGSLRTQLERANVLIPTLERTLGRLIDNDNYREAESVVDLGKPVYRRAANDEDNYRWSVLVKRVEEGKRLLPHVAKYIDTLAEDPDDPAANYAVGWYMCMVKDNWMQGAKLLAKSDDEQLRMLAQLEIQGDASMDRHVRLGDAWWDYAERHKKEKLLFEGALQRSRKWYLSASEGLAGGLDRIRANNRLDNIDRLIGKVPRIVDGQTIR